MSEDIRDIKGLMALFAVPSWLPWALLGLAAAAAFWLWRRRRPKREARPGPAPAPPSARERALRELAQLDSMALVSPEAIRRLHYRFSEILRHYVEGHYGVPATDRTTEELKELLADARFRRLLDLLEEADRVKFTDLRPDPATCRKRLQEGAAWVEGTS